MEAKGQSHGNNIPSIREPGKQERYQSDFEPSTVHEQFLVNQMVGARWKLDRIERIENAMFAAYQSAGDPVTTEALVAQAFIDKDTGNGFARLDRYRASLERTYHRCARELRAAKKIQNEPNSAKPTENKLDKLVKHMLETPIPASLMEQMAEARREYAARRDANKAANAGS